MMARVAYALMAAAFLFLTIMYDFYTPFLALMAVLLAPIPSICLAFRASRHLSIQISGDRNVQRGGTLRIAARLSAPGLSWLPLPRLTSPQLLNPVVSDDDSFHFQIPAPHCGVQKTGPFSILITDAFRLVRFRKTIEGQSLIILPRRMGTYEGTLSALARLMKQEESEHFGAVEYKPGDDVHLINWKVTARKDALYVRDTVPAGGASLILAANLPEDADARDTVCDALLTLGSALLAYRKPFSFLRLEGKTPLLSEIRTDREWTAALTHFLGRGRKDNPLSVSSALLPPDIPVLYLTDETKPALPSMVRVSVWSADPSARADLAGRAAIANALGGDPA